MNLAECKEACIEIWTELAQTGKYHKPTTEFVNNCPCCQFVQDGAKISADRGGIQRYLPCELCPVKWVSRQRDGEGNCQSKGSVYTVWELSSTRERAAQKVLEFLQTTEWKDFFNGEKP
jgi:formate dehydrogenase maturation protein FdhE